MERLIYLDNAATTFPKPDTVIRSSIDCLKNYCGNPGRGSHTLALRAAEAVYECRETAANLFGAESPDNVVITMNTTYALNIAIKSVVRPGDHLLISDIEHNAVLRPVAALAKSGVITYNIFPTSGTHDEIAAAARSRITKNTRALVCTLASNIFGRTLPSEKLGELCKEAGILFIADGAQAAGHRDIDMKSEGIDILCIPGHKGLYGPQGIGLMLCRSDVGQTFIEGGSGSSSADLYMPEFLPDRYEAGTLSTPAAVGLCAGMRFVKRNTCKAIAAHEEELWNMLYSRLYDDKRFRMFGTDDGPSSVMLIEKRGQSPAKLGMALNERGICARAGLHCAPLAHKLLGTMPDGGVRISFGAFNTKSDVTHLCDALLHA